MESELPRFDDLVSQIGHYASSQLDARHAAQAMETCRGIPIGLDTHFHRRALIDGAIITYMRIFAAGKRTKRASAEPLLGYLTTEEREVHHAVNLWRHEHAAHWSGKQFEEIESALMWPGFGIGLPEIRVRVATAFRPDIADFESRFEELAALMSILIWERRMYPLQQQILERLGPNKVAQLHQQATAREESDWPGPILGVRFNVGSKPPPSDPRESFLLRYPAKPRVAPRRTATKRKRKH